MVDQLAQEYAGQPVIFIEYDLEDLAYADRKSHWWAANGSGSVSLPMMMAESGKWFTSGYSSDFYTRLKTMTDAALALPPQAEISAEWLRVGETVQMTVTVKNTSGVALSAANGAHLHTIVYIDEKRHDTSRFVVGASQTEITLGASQTKTFTPTALALSSVDWGKLHVLALVDYRPGGATGASQTLQAALATTNAAPVKARIYLPVVQK